MKFTKFAGIFAILLAFALSVIAQTTNPTPPPKIEDDGDIIKVESRLVVVPVSVLDSIGQPVLGLKAQDFRILEESLNRKPPRNFCRK
ncbi:MAG: hypothetical protein LC768_06960 [Acidobacteria bacterium]|nr:hypothetical protein [Acidobacteriota bacterium]